jgi:hypothetical protein
LAKVIYFIEFHLINLCSYNASSNRHWYYGEKIDKKSNDINEDTSSLIDDQIKTILKPNKTKNVVIQKGWFPSQCVEMEKKSSKKQSDNNNDADDTKNKSQTKSNDKKTK